MDPIPESAEAIAEISRVTGDTELRSRLELLAARVQEVVPDCLGLSLTALDHDVTITLVASDDFVQVLDAMQYVVDGPCEQSVRDARTLDLVVEPSVEGADGGAGEDGQDADEATDEHAWQLFARAAAAHGVASTLSMPILEGGRVTGGVNLYGGSARCFLGHHEELAAILEADASAAVTNADLGFTTRDVARRGPEVLRAAEAVDRASGMLAATRGLSTEEAQRRIRQAAERAGVAEQRVAEVVIEVLGRSD